jgi:hypothetical protein
MRTKIDRQTDHYLGLSCKTPKVSRMFNTSTTNDIFLVFAWNTIFKCHGSLLGGWQSGKAGPSSSGVTNGYLLSMVFVVTLRAHVSRLGLANPTFALPMLLRVALLSLLSWSQLCCTGSWTGQPIPANWHWGEHNFCRASSCDRVICKDITSLPIGTGENITSAGRRLVTESYARISHSMYRHSCSSSLLVAMVLLVVVDGLSEILLPPTNRKMFGFHSPVLHAVWQSDLSKIRNVVQQIRFSMFPLST